MAPSRSSTVTIAQALPVLVILRVTAVTSPQIVTGAFVGAVLVGQQLADGAVGGVGQHVLEPGQRVVGDVEAEHLALVAEQGLLVPLLDVGHHDADPEAESLSSPSSPPNRESWPMASLRLMSTYWSTACSWTASSARRPCFIVVEGTGLDQRLDDAACCRPAPGPCP